MVMPIMLEQRVREGIWVSKDETVARQPQYFFLLVLSLIIFRVEEWV
jgi:hypothetical protein